MLSDIPYHGYIEAVGPSKLSVISNTLITVCSVVPGVIFCNLSLFYRSCKTKFSVISNTLITGCSVLPRVICYYLPLFYRSCKTKLSVISNTLITGWFVNTSCFLI